METAKTIIGKDVIESLTLGMYEDSRFIFREYIQNAADQIDIAVEKGIFKSRDEGRIEILIDKTNRKISIYDNATGIEKAKVLPVLKNIAQGIKDRTKHKGFRGIGRLGGLAYCDKLIFETSFEGEKTKSILEWDAKKLKEIINDRHTKEEATEVIDRVTLFKEETAKAEYRFFKVTLENVSNNLLLDQTNIREYLSMVAPAPYDKGFIFKDIIYKKAIEHNYSIDEYPIYINHNQIFKAYTTRIYEGDKNNKRRIDDIHDIDFFEYKNYRGELIYWGWYSISTFLKQIPKINLARGIRLRKGNIQIGMENCLVKLFKEQRGSYYFFGEVFAVSPRLIPNARRDYFLENDTLYEFEKNLKILFNDLHDLYHFSSKIRNTKKQIERFEISKMKYNEKIKKGFTNNEEKEKYEKELEKNKNIAENAQEQLEKIEEKVKKENKKSERKIFEKVVGKHIPKVEEVKIEEIIKSETKYITDDLTQLNRKERKLVSKIFQVIDIILTPDLAENLKQKIKEELKK